MKQPEEPVMSSDKLDVIGERLSGVRESLRQENISLGEIWQIDCVYDAIAFNISRN